MVQVTEMILYVSAAYNSDWQLITFLQKKQRVYPSQK